jgi:hypothetical protein
VKFGRGKVESASRVAVELPRNGENVTLLPGGNGRIPSRVLEANQAALRVAVMIPVEPFSAGQLERMVIEFLGPQGRVRLAGVASMEDQDVVCIVSPRPLNVVQDREYVRLRTTRPVLVFGGEDLIRVDGCTIDISGGGFLLAGDGASLLKSGDDVQFQLQLSAEELPVCGSGKVVREDASGHRGIVFKEVKDLDRRRLVRFIFECQRSDLRMGIGTDEHHGA